MTAPFRKLFLLALLAAPLAACRHAPPDEGPFEVAPVSFDELRRHLLAHDPALEHFDQPGPFKYRVAVNRAIPLGSGETVVVDMALPEPASKAPLVVLTHGNHSRKEAHRYQAERLASFGMYAVVLQLPNTSRWVDNGRTIARLVRKLRQRPSLVDREVDTSRIILVGHSFGGSAITLAAARGARPKGLILLDPAVVTEEVKRAMRRVKAPVILLGADKRVFRARQRRAFYKNISGEMGEVSVVGATHDDAQSPSMFALAGVGIDPFTSPERQETFTAAIAASAFSMAATDGLDYVWDALEEEVEAGELRGARRREARPAAAKR